MGTLHEFPRLGASPKADDRGSDIAFGLVLVVLWVCSVARVYAAASTHEVFGAEASLAFACLLAIPLVALRSWRRSRAPRAVAGGSPDQERSLRNRHLTVVAASRRRG